MAITRTYLDYAASTGTSTENRPPNAFLRYICDTEADRPSVNVIDGDRAYTVDTGKRWDRIAGAWVLQTTDNLANTLLLSDATVLTCGAVADGQLLSRSGTTVIGATAASAAWGGITGTLSAQTDLQAALDAKQATLVSGTNIKTINGSTLLGSGNLSVSASDPSYTPGSFTVSTGTGRLLIKRLQLTTTERATVAGTARLKVA